jgi:hypothetical protein
MAARTGASTGSGSAAVVRAVIIAYGLDAVGQ